MGDADYVGLNSISAKLFSGWWRRRTSYGSRSSHNVLLTVYVEVTDSSVTSLLDELSRKGSI